MFCLLDVAFMTDLRCCVLMCYFIFMIYSSFTDVNNIFNIVLIFILISICVLIQKDAAICIKLRL